MLARFFRQHLPFAVLAALPLVGLVAGPAYAPLVFGLGILEFAWLAASTKRMPSLDLPLLAIAVVFAGLCWASTAWSIVPERTLRGALQATVVLASALVFLAQKPLPETASAAVMRVMAGAFLVGGALLAFDTAAEFPIQGFLSKGADVPAKYNRGVIYAIVIAWPVAAYLWRSRARASLGALVVGLGTMVVVVVAVTAKLAALAGLAVLGLSALAPRIMRPILLGGAAALVSILPFLLSVITGYRGVFAPYLKESGLHRLEIWNYMTARVLERPFAGWGFWSASSVPIHPEELSGYTMVHPQGIYPHDQWLQLWTETGALGAALGIAFILLVWRRLRAMPSAMQPFALAAFAAAMLVSLVDYDVAGDSWWAALAACAFLFTLAAEPSTGSERSADP